jgi:hypothetical protein
LEREIGDLKADPNMLLIPFLDFLFCHMTHIHDGKWDKLRKVKWSKDALENIMLFIPDYLKNGFNDHISWEIHVIY